MAKNSALPRESIAEQIAARLPTLEPQRDPAARALGERLLLDIAGLCVAARHADYVRAAIAAVEQPGPCTVIGEAAGLTLGAEGAAFVNGTAAHGEDFDDTYEGGPVHAGAVIVPALLAAAERHRLDGADLLRGIAIGCELMCRLCRVAPMRVHKAGFHPTAVFGAFGATAGIGAALRLTPAQQVDAFGIAGSLASGIIEYLAEGSWTKRLHAGWAAQSGYRAVRLAMAGFKGPRTVFEGEHGVFRGFANTDDGNFAAMLDGFGSEWSWLTIAFKPYPCGTMIHPYIDCARRLAARGVPLEGIREIACDVGEGTVHRLWEPLAAKRRPPNGYAAKFSIPYAIAVGLLRDDAGLAEYDDALVHDGRLTALARKIHYRIDPDNPYPQRFTGHLRVLLKDGREIVERQDYFRGGAEHPLGDAAIDKKFFANCAFGGMSAAAAEALARAARGVFSQASVKLA